MRVYVASAFGNKSAVRAAQAFFLSHGHSITHDWTVEDASHLEPGSPEWRQYLFSCGTRDFNGVASAEALVVLAHPDMRDTRVELGLALGLGLRVVVVDHPEVFSVFYGMATLVPDLETAVSQLQNDAGPCGSPGDSNSPP